MTLAAWLLLFADPPTFVRTEDVVYGRKHGVALTLDVLRPAKANRKGVLWVVSGGWFSSHDSIHPDFVKPLLDRGYTVFAVVHGSQPKYTIPEILGDMHRATRFVRTNAERFGVDPARLGITGGSAGGHLSLMQGVAGEDGNPLAHDPVERASSRVQSVACFFPPTDFLNYGEAGNVQLGTGTLKNFRPPFDFRETEKGSNRQVLIEDEPRRIAIGRRISPACQATPDDAPTLIIHGDADALVPIQQAELMVAALRKARVRAELEVRKGAGHGWPTMVKDVGRFADWFDETLVAPKPAAHPSANASAPAAAAKK